MGCPRCGSEDVKVEMVFEEEFSRKGTCCLYYLILFPLCMFCEYLDMDTTGMDDLICGGKKARKNKVTYGICNKCGCRFRNRD